MPSTARRKKTPPTTPKAMGTALAFPECTAVGVVDGEVVDGALDEGIESFETTSAPISALSAVV
jgi:hypothetical protein